MSLLDELLEKVEALDPQTRAQLEKEVEEQTGDMKWIPNPGP